jgi:hypothetical protein
MSIPKFIKKIAVQTAVYWGNPVNDGYGGYTYDAPVEIKCRWEEKVRTIADVFGEYRLSKATVLVNDPLDYNGYLYLGTLAEVNAMTGVTTSKPKTIPMAFAIIAYDKIPLIKSTTQFVNIVYLGFRNL